METKQTRKQTSKELNIDIQPARVRRELDTFGLNKSIEEHIKIYKNTVVEYKRAKKELELRKVCNINADDNKRELTPDELHTREKYLREHESVYKDHEKAVSALTKQKIRFSEDASNVLSIVSDSLIRQLAIFAMENATRDGKKTIQLKHLHEPEVEKLSYYPLIKTLPIFIKTFKQFDDDRKSEQMAKKIKDIQKEAEREFKKKYNITKKQEKPDKTEKVEKIDKVEKTDKTVDKEHTEEENRKVPFRFFVDTLCKNICENSTEFKSMSISNNVKVYLSDVLVDLISRICPLLRIITRSMKNKTINSKSVLNVIEFILSDGYKLVEHIEITNKDGEYQVIRNITCPGSSFNELSRIIDVKIASVTTNQKQKKEPKEPKEPKQTKTDNTAPKPKPEPKKKEKVDKVDKLKKTTTITK